MMRLYGVLSILALLSVTFLLPINAAGPIISVDTVPTIEWSTALNQTLQTRLGEIEVDTQSPSLFVVRQHVVTAYDKLTGSAQWSYALPVTSDSRCFQPRASRGDSIYMAYITCTPNVLFAVKPGALVWQMAFASSSLIPASGNRPASYVPVFDASPIVSSGKDGKEWIVVTGSGVMFAVTKDGPQGAQTKQFGPFEENLFSIANSSITDIQLLSLDPSIGSVIVAATGANSLPSSIVPGALFVTQIPTLADESWSVNNLIQTGNLTLPMVDFTLTYSRATGHAWVGLAYYHADPPYDQKFEMVRFDRNAPFGTAPIRWMSEAVMDLFRRDDGVLESPDGKYLLPTHVNTVLPIVNAMDGSYVTWWDLSEFKGFDIKFATLIFDNNSLYLVAENILIVIEFDPTKPHIGGIKWSFSWAERLSGGFMPMLPATTIFQMSWLPVHYANSTDRLFVYTGYVEGQHPDSIDGSNTARLWLISSTVAPQCHQLRNVNQLCGGCNSQTGVTTARNCAYCKADSQCTEYYSLDPIFALNQTCADDGFPLPIDECTGGHASENQNAAIIVGCIGGGILAIGIVFCLIMKRRLEMPPTASTQDNYRRI